MPNSNIHNTNAFTIARKQVIAVIVFAIVITAVIFMMISGNTSHTTSVTATQPQSVTPTATPSGKTIALNGFSATVLSARSVPDDSMYDTSQII